MKKNIYKLSADTNTIVSFSAIIVAVASIFISTWQGMEIRKHNRLSVRPKLEIHFYINKQDFGYSLLNNGLGPANIIENKVLFNNVEISSNDPSSWYQSGLQQMAQECSTVASKADSLIGFLNHEKSSH